jgi:mRNA-degrading endonuclease toxin of MazEF toxin-antitoxin module
LSPAAYNQRSGLLVCVPITNQIKGYPFEVVLTGNAANGAALADQVKSLDWKTRQAEKRGSPPQAKWPRSGPRSGRSSDSAEKAAADPLADGSP